jgi:hypothetical protein
MTTQRGLFGLLAGAVAAPLLPAISSLASPTIRTIYVPTGIRVGDTIYYQTERWIVTASTDSDIRKAS